MSTNAFIADGYNERAYVGEVPRLYPAVRFEYRPTPLQELVGYRREVAKLGELDTYKHAAKFLAGKLVSWDLKDDKGEPAPLKTETILRLRHPLFLRILAIVHGLEAPDDDPQAADGERFNEGRDEKNS